MAVRKQLKRKEEKNSIPKEALGKKNIRKRETPTNSLYDEIISSEEVKNKIFAHIRHVADEDENEVVEWLAQAIFYPWISQPKGLWEITKSTLRYLNSLNSKD